MTVIAWDGKTLAADRRADAGFSYSVTKIHRVGDYLVGISGFFGDCGRILEWVKGGRDPEKYPKQEENRGSTVVVISRDGTVERYEACGYPIRVEEPMHATGSGVDYALATMYLGFSASEAVVVASAFDSQCGNGIDTLSFDEAP